MVMISILAVAQLVFFQAEALTQPSAEYKVCLPTVVIICISGGQLNQTKIFIYLFKIATFVHLLDYNNY